MPKQRTTATVADLKRHLAGQRVNWNSFKRQDAPSVSPRRSRAIEADIEGGIPLGEKEGEEGVHGENLTDTPTLRDAEKDAESPLTVVEGNKPPMVEEKPKTQSSGVPKGLPKRE